VKKVIAVAAALAIGAAVSPITVSAQPAPEVLPACRDLLNNIRPADVIAAGYQATCIATVTAMVIAANEIPNETVCVPTAFTARELTSIIVEYIGRSADLQAEDFAFAVVDAMTQLWACR
jgi:hypothetical protein